MKRALLKDTIRDIKKSLGRYVSIIAIVSLSVAFFSGLKTAPMDMKKTADAYYDDYNLMDFKVLSTFGLNDDDIEALKNIDDIEGIYPTNSLDALTKYDSQEMVLKVHGLPLDKINTDNKDYINRVKLVDGRLPTKSGECVVEVNKMDPLTIPIGTNLNLSSGTNTPLSDSLKTTQYTVVGTVETPYYLSYEKGSSSIGNGDIRSFIMIPQEDFNMSAYTEAFITLKDTKKLNSYKDKYFEDINNVSEEIKGISENRIAIRYDEVMKEATDELNKGKEEYENQKNNVIDKLTNAYNEIKNSKSSIAKGEEELRKNENSLNSFVKESQSKIKQGEAALLEAEKQFNNGLNAFNQVKQSLQNEIISYETKIKNIDSTIHELNNKITQMENKLQDPLLSNEDKTLIEEKITSNKEQIQKLQQEFENSKNLINEKQNSLKIAEEKLNSSQSVLAQTKLSLEEGKKIFEQGKKKALKGLKQGKEKIEEGKSALTQGELDFEEGKLKAKEELQKAEGKIKDAEDEIKNIERPEWYILDRKSHYSYVDYGNSADSIDALAKIFPVFFFLVAALVCLTTITRMVDEQRVNIGTLKALGYSKFSIAAKYVIYALSASLIGSIIGLLIGFTVFPEVVFNAYGMMYTLPPVIKVFDLPLALMITLVAVSITTLTAYYACSKELFESPSMLMRPKAPQDGKRILLERIPFIWNRLGFIGKVTVRNIFRYKKRFFMTVFGISGCTALLVSGFGIKDSIETIVDKQFGTIFKYDMTISLNSEIDLNQKNNIINAISNNDNISSYEFINNQNGKALNNDVEKAVSILIPENINKIDNLIHLQDRKNEETTFIPQRGVLLSEKLANQLNAKVGSNIELINSHDKKVSIEVAGIVENYVSNYVYMSPQYYNEIFDRSVDYNAIISSLKDISKEAENNISTEIMSEDGLVGLSFNSAIKANFDNTIKSLGYVVLVMILSAGALAFVVLYNLTNVNISERLREIATIKVLGFYDNEVSAYIYRENLILTLIGTLTGLGLGVFLHKFIMITVELDNMMFGRNINTSSFIISAALTILFAILVNFAMYYKLKNIQMVESLKSVD